MKKGFTLIELLAVIVILAIIALIATPIVLNIINDTRESAKIRSAELYIDALEQAIIRKKLNEDTSFNPSSCEISQGVITCDGESIQVEADGTLPSDGSITLNNGKVEYYDLKFDDKYVVYENGETTLQDQVSYFVGDEYTLKNKANFKVVATNETINNFDIELYHVVVLSDGSEWYYLNESGDTVTLLSKYNYFTSGTNMGEMDPSGAVNAIAATSEEYAKEFIGSCDSICDEEGNCEEHCDTYTEAWFDDYITPFINNTIKPKILQSLSINEEDVTVDLLTGTEVQEIYLRGEEAALHTSPLYWVKDGDGACTTLGLVYQSINSAIAQDCSSSADTAKAGVRIKLTIPKSYIKLILYPTIKLSSKFYYSNSLNFEIIEETDEYILILGNFDYSATHENNTMKVLIENTKYEVKNITSLGIESVASALGFYSECDENTWCTIDFGDATNHYNLPDGYVMGDYQDMILSRIYK